VTIHEDLAEALWVRIQRDPDAVARMFELRNRHIDGEMLDEGIYGSGYADSLGSSARFRPEKWPPHQHAAFIAIHSMIGSGEAGFTCISTGGAPGADADRAGNAAKLAQTHSHFRADLDMGQNCADQDGVLSWAEPLHISRPTGQFFYPSPCKLDGQAPLVELTVGVAPRSVPLEVGDSWPSRTYMHLVQHGAVARWPYGSKLIWLFINFEHHNTTILPRASDLSPRVGDVVGAA
jgi:hypothetical protein